MSVYLRVCISSIIYAKLKLILISTISVYPEYNWDNIYSLRAYSGWNYWSRPEHVKKFMDKIINETVSKVSMTFVNSLKAY